MLAWFQVKLKYWMAERQARQYGKQRLREELDKYFQDLRGQNDRALADAKLKAAVEKQLADRGITNANVRIASAEEHKTFAADIASGKVQVLGDTAASKPCDCGGKGQSTWH